MVIKNISVMHDAVYNQLFQNGIEVHQSISGKYSFLVPRSAYLHDVVDGHRRILCIHYKDITIHIISVGESKHVYVYRNPLCDKELHVW